MILVDMHLLEIEEIAQTPFVSSINPIMIPSENLSDIPNVFKNGDIASDNPSKILLLFRIDIITEKRTINPPIRKIVLIALFIEFDKTSPRLDIETVE